MAAILSVMALGGFAGVALVRSDLPLADAMRATLNAAQEISAEGFARKSDIHTLGSKPPGPYDFISPPVRDAAAGTVLYDAERAQMGYTLYTPFFFGNTIRLIDMRGRTLHEWAIPADAYTGDRPDNFVLGDSPMPMISIASVSPNGDLLLVFSHGREMQPWGYGLAKINKDSQLLWTYLRQAHHGLDVMPDGKIVTMVHTMRDEPRPGLDWVALPFQDDSIVILSPEGEELRKVSVLEAIQNSAWASLLMYADPEAYEGDLLHLNSARYLDAEQAAHIPGATQGDLLISLRNLDIVAVMSLAGPTIKWAARGPWHMQHDAQVLANGNLLIFDNRGDPYRGGASRIIEVDPESMAIEWRYPLAPDDPLYTVVCGSAQRLANGNTLISETNNGRILEVTRDGDIVWDYRIPERYETEAGELVAKAWHAQRIDPADVPFLGEAETN